MCKILSLIALRGKRESALGERDSERMKKKGKEVCVCWGGGGVEEATGVLILKI